MSQAMIIAQLNKAKARVDFYQRRGLNPVRAIAAVAYLQNQLQKNQENPAATVEPLSVDETIARLDKLRAWFDERVPAEEPEPAQPVVELDPQAVAGCESAYRAAYSDVFGGPTYEFEGATDDDFDECGNWRYRASP